MHRTVTAEDTHGLLVMSVAKHIPPGLTWTEAITGAAMGAACRKGRTQKTRHKGRSVTDGMYQGRYGILRVLSDGVDGVKASRGGVLTLEVSRGVRDEMIGFVF